MTTGSALASTVGVGYASSGMRPFRSTISSSVSWELWRSCVSPRASKRDRRSILPRNRLSQVIRAPLHRRVRGGLSAPATDSGAESLHRCGSQNTPEPRRPGYQSDERPHSGDGRKPQVGHERASCRVLLRVRLHGHHPDDPQQIQKPRWRMASRPQAGAITPDLFRQRPLGGIGEMRVQMDARSASAAACRRALTSASSRAARSMRSCCISVRSRCWSARSC